MSKGKIRHGGVVKCDMVTVVENAATPTTGFTDACKETFTTYSLASKARPQSANIGWVRVFARRVQWPGAMPCAPDRKVDLCPTHAACVRPAETKEERIARKALEKERRKSTRLEAKRVAKDLAASSTEAAKARADEERRRAGKAELRRLTAAARRMRDAKRGAKPQPAVTA